VAGSLEALAERMSTLSITPSIKCLKATYEKGLKDVKLFSKILSREGISEKVIDLVFDTQPDGMTWVSVPMATGYGLVN